MIVSGIYKSFGNTPVLQNLSFSVKPGTTLSVAGRSGCGKTTLLKILAGLEVADAGTVTFEGVDVGALSPERRNMVYLNQEPLLFPHMNVRDNLAFGLKIRRVSKKDISDRLDELILRLGLSGLGSRMPENLSGGQRQRVAFGRALAIRPSLLLLDEPFGSLDPDTRSEMQSFFLELKANFHITSVFVTHDVKEAIRMGDSLARMEDGVLIQYKDLQQMLSDEHSGIKNELAFWRKLLSEYESNQ
jgi:ABC-type sugar transport system ATPase subunit